MYRIMFWLKLCFGVPRLLSRKVGEEVGKPRDYRKPHKPMALTHRLS